MTTVYGSWKPSSSSVPRMRLIIEYTIDSVSAGETSTVVRPVCKLEFYGNVDDSSNTFTRGGTLTSALSTAKTIVGGYETITLDDFDKTVSLTDSPQTKTLTYSLTGINAIGTSYKAEVSATITIPAKVYDPPAAATSLTITRQADNRHVLSWGASPTAAAPISHFQIGRQVYPSTGWSYPAYPSGTARSWTDTTDLADKQIRWAVRAYNSSGGSAWAYSSYVWTTPAAASNVQVARVGADAAVSWTVNATAAVAQKIQVSSSADFGGTWSAWVDVVGHTGLAPTITSRTISGLSGAEWHRFRVVTSVTTPVALASESVASAALVLLTAPLAPTPLAPLGTVSTIDDAVFLWDHRPVDTTAQTAAEVEWSDDDWLTSTTETATTAETLTVTAGTFSVGTVKWRARTKGQHADWSPWSSTVSLEVAAPPAVTIDTPTDLSTWTSNRLTATISFTDPQGASMTGWSATLATGGQIIESLTGTGTTVAPVSLLTDGEDCTLSVVATSGTGLVSSAATVTVPVDFVDPLPPTIEATWDEPHGTVSLVVGFATPTGGEAVTDHVYIERSDDDGQTWATIAEDLPDLAGVGDDRVPLNATPTYRATAVSALGVEASATTTVTTTTSKVWLNGDAGVSVYVEHDLDMRTSDAVDDVLVAYLGDDYPTLHSGTALTDQVSVSGVWIDATGMAQRPSSLRGQPVWYRDPAGRAWWAAISSYDGTDPWSQLRGVSFTATRIQAPSNG